MNEIIEHETRTMSLLTALGASLFLIMAMM